MIKNVICNKSKKHFCTFLHLYVFYVCATFQVRGFKVICILVSALKSKMATISMETKSGEKNYFFVFSIFVHTDQMIILNVQ